MCFPVKLHRLLGVLGFEPRNHAPNANGLLCVPNAK